MELDKKTIKGINDFVYIKPRTIDEIAKLINKNWRTADRHVKKMAEEEGTIALRTFRGGTRGALKIVFWNNLENIHSSQAQERLFKQIELGKDKQDFSPFDIYQFADEKKRSSFFEDQKESAVNEAINIKQDLVGTLRSAQRQVLFFSGNLSWANLVQGKIKVIDVFEELAKRDVSLKFLTKVDILSVKRAQKINAINLRLGKDRIEIRHCEQPLRAFIVDDRVVKLKEIKDPEDYKKKKNEKTYVFYEIYDEEWISWLQKVFWNFFRTAIPAQKRIKDLKTIKKI